MPAPYATIACFIEDGPACRVVLDEAIALRAQSEGVLQVVHVIAEPAAAAVGALRRARADGARRRARGGPVARGDGGRTCRAPSR